MTSLTFIPIHYNLRGTASISYVNQESVDDGFTVLNVFINTKCYFRLHISPPYHFYGIKRNLVFEAYTKIFKRS